MKRLSSCGDTSSSSSGFTGKAVVDGKKIGTQSSGSGNGNGY
jgi:hypothetical protein